MLRVDLSFLAVLRDTIEGLGGDKADVLLVDSQNSQPTQNDQIDTFISKGVKALAIAPVDRATCEVMLDKAMKAKVPIVFFNGEPEPEVLKKWDKTYYVGAIAEESGRLQGEIIADFWKANPGADKNKDGVLQYVMLMGDPGHQDSHIRTEYSIKAIKDAGIKVQKLAQDIAMWERVKGQEKMAAFISQFGNKIEAVLANSDDMALGAIEALKAAGYLKGDKASYVPVVGVDATAPALQQIELGTMLGTVLNDAKKQGKATFNISYVLATGQTPSKENVGFEITNGKYIWVPYVKITKDNIKESTNVE